MRAMLPHGEAETMHDYTTGMDAPDLDLVERYVPAVVLAETFGLIHVTRTVMRADSTTYVFEHTRDIFGRERCRALRFTPHPLPPAPPRFDPNHPAAWPPAQPALTPAIEYLDVKCDDARIQVIAPGSLKRPASGSP
jgi:hypothetical protein